MNYHCGFVTIIGRPNVGKSTLLNRFIGQKLAITSHKPQTTRHSLLGIKTCPNGQILFIDTPGLHQRGKNALNRALNRIARGAIEHTDLVLFILEAGIWTQEDTLVLNTLAHLSNIPCIGVLNKVDQLQNRESLLPYLASIAQRRNWQALIPVSAQVGDQMEVLEQEILALLPLQAALFPEDQVSDRPQRFFAAELLREQLTRRYAKELPYQLAVEIENFQEQGNLYRISAVIWVERAAQKAIIIGHNGLALKATAKAARLEMERFFNCKVHLEVWVRLKSNWTHNEDLIASL
ncbi:GTPase Era [Achromatium sp. WMS3]|nr:GTPase Era [Achromatium sp. WMS3]